MPAAKVKSSGRRRLLLLTAAALSAVACLTFGLLGASAAPIQTTSTTLAITDAATGQPITGTIQSTELVDLTVTVTSGSPPSGNVAIVTTPGNTPVCDGNDSCSWHTKVSSGTTSQVTVPLYLLAGSYGLQASFRPDSGSGFLGSTSSPPVQVSVASVTPLTTVTVLTVNPGTIIQGQPATLTATVTSATGPTPQGKVEFYATSGNVETHVGEGTLSPAGVATVTSSDWAVGTTSLEADYLGDTFVDQNGNAQAWKSSSNVPDEPVSLTVGLPGSAADTIQDLPDATAYLLHPATLSATLLDQNGNPLPNEPVSLSANDPHGTTCSAVTGANGVASCTAVFPTPGTFTVTAFFAGDATYAPSIDASQRIEVDKATTAATYTGAATAVSGTQATLAGQLVDTVSGTPVQGETLTLTLNGNETCSATTDATGTASCPVTVGEAASATPYPVSVSYAGSGTYGASSGSGSLTVTNQVPTTLAYVGDSQVVRGNQATLAAKLLSAGQPVQGKTVTLTLASGEQCSATTDSTGLASCLTTTAVGDPGGPDAVTLAFAGDSLYLPSTGSGTITVLVPTTTTLAPLAPVLQGSSAQLAATLTAGGSPVAGQTLTLSLGSQSCSGTTGASGAATCTISKVSAPLGPATTAASFAGAGFYLSSSATGSAWVYALPKGGGAFVVGDRSDTGSVTFWGAQWWKDNSLSGGGDPASFKGFAANVPALACGGTWSTDPGNSSPPPPGPLPAYMAVLVSSNNAKSGSQISGNIVAIVIVRTDSGYQPNPGHTGTGTVVATLCKSGS